MSSRLYWKYRILYVGRDHALSAFLKDALKDLRCCVVRCPGARESRCLIESKIKYALLLFDEELPDRTGAELERFTRLQAHRRRTPVVIFKKSDDWQQLASYIRRRLG